MIDLKLEDPHALLSPSLLPTFTPLGTNLSLSPAVRCCKMKNGGYNFLQEGTEHSLARQNYACCVGYGWAGMFRLSGRGMSE